MSVSLCMMTLNPPVERLIALIELCRPTISDVVIVVDDRTDAGTVEIMRAWPSVTLIPFRWVDDFSAGRNAALPHATGDWILHLDPDEIPTERMLAHIRAIDAIRSTPFKGFIYATENWWGGESGGEPQPSDWHCRLFRRDAGKWYRAVHELVRLDDQAESESRNAGLMGTAPREAYIIHSKAKHVLASDVIYYDAIANRIGL